MPQIQYSEKYYDDIYEYRYGAHRDATVSRARAGIVLPTRRTAFAREGPWGFSPRLDGTRDGPPATRSRDIGLSARIIRRRYADTRVRARAYRSAASRRLRRRVFRARAGSRSVPAAYPFEIASPLTSPSRLYRHRQTRRPSPRHRQAAAQGSPALRGAFREPRYGSTPPPRPATAPAIPKPRCRNASQPLSTRCPGACAGPFRATPRSTRARRARTAELTRASGFPSLSRQAEWRGLGVQQSRGWVHYAIHRPEPHIMLYRCASRRGSARAFANFSRALAADPAAAPGGAAAIGSRVARVRDVAAASGARLRGDAHAVDATVASATGV